MPLLPGLYSPYLRILMKAVPTSDCFAFYRSAETPSVTRNEKKRKKGVGTQFADYLHCLQSAKPQLADSAALAFNL